MHRLYANVNVTLSLSDPEINSVDAKVMNKSYENGRIRLPF